MRTVAIVAILVGANLASANELLPLDAIRHAAPGCATERTYCFAIQLHVAETETGLVTTPAWVAA